MVVFPLFSILPDGTCACSNPSCSRVGKHPKVKWGELKAGDPVPRPEAGEGVGIKTGAEPYGSGFIVVDLDSQEASDLFDSMGGCDDTHTVSTPRGYHLRFKHPGFPVKNSAGELGKGIDIRGERGFVVAPGSPHISGTPYEVLHDLPYAPVPPWLVDWLRTNAVVAAPTEHVDDVTDPVERRRRQEMYARYLAREAPARGAANRGRGDTILYEVVQRGAYDLALPTEDVLELIAEHYEPRCNPPWGEELEERVYHKAKYAKEHSTRERRAPLSQAEEETLSDILGPVPDGMVIEKAPEKASFDANDPDFGFKVRRGGWDQTPIPPRYLVEGLLLEGKVNMIFADPGSIKSWLANSLAGSVSAGMAWLGERPTTKGKVLYIDYEDGEHEFHRRVHMLTGREDRPDLWYLYAPGNLDVQEVWLRLAKFVKAHGVTFLVLDTLAGGTPGVDENDRNAADALTYAGRFTEATGVTVLFLHHANRSGEIRGTSAFKANVDSLFKLETITDENGVHRARLTCTKSGQKKVMPVCLELTDAGLTRYEEPEKTAEEKKDEKKDRRTLHELKAEVLLTIESQGPIASQAMVRTLVKASMTNVGAVMSELEAAGDIVKTDDGWVRDSESARKERLREVLRAHTDWSRGKVTDTANVTVPFFEKCLRVGLVRPLTDERSTVGFVWIDP